MDFLVPFGLTLVAFALLVMAILAIPSIPWPILLSLLVMGIILTQWLIDKTENKTIAQPVATIPKIESPPAAKPTKESTRVYRGVIYEAHEESVIKTSNQDPGKKQIEIAGNYRGSVWKISKLVPEKKEK